MKNELNKVRGFEFGPVTLFLVMVDGEHSEFSYYKLHTLLVNGVVFDFHNQEHLDAVAKEAMNAEEAYGIANNVLMAYDFEDPITGLVVFCQIEY